MGIGGISVGSLLLILIIVLLVFGTKKLRNVGGDLGGAIKGFRSAMKDGESNDKDDDQEPAQLQSRSQEGEEITRKTDTSESRDRSSS
ncbi:sec-independent protein translocase protein TatA [Natronocella acetinitrilica]|uniref:Sec-independent protein translocase protein TatA n=1 Tax=Natronocella acetinitrilica TaxID=414046 RepID=A0AAE3G0S8_9GAMM|nr:twin-arginine translocase TatA/TatE family subunit [Natronocella acetinitrilica]MCP1673292.1 sec-independent protein translocase protein TatA [Natronocella acetinitrilica]